jgi:hypothetical protein
MPCVSAQEFSDQLKKRTVACKIISSHLCIFQRIQGRRGRNRMVVGFTTIYAIGSYHHWCCGIDSRSGREWLAASRWFSLVFSTIKTDCHNIAEILLIIVLNTINQPKQNQRNQIKSYKTLDHRHSTDVQWIKCRVNFFPTLTLHFIHWTSMSRL